jgi:hypothetical protein
MTAAENERVEPAAQNENRGAEQKNDRLVSGRERVAVRGVGQGQKQYRRPCGPWATALAGSFKEDARRRDGRNYLGHKHFVEINPDYAGHRETGCLGVSLEARPAVAAQQGVAAYSGRWNARYWCVRLGSYLQVTDL